MSQTKLIFLIRDQLSQIRRLMLEAAVERSDREKYHISIFGENKTFGYFEATRDNYDDIVQHVCYNVCGMYNLTNPYENVFALRGDGFVTFYKHDKTNLNMGNEAPIFSISIKKRERDENKTPVDESEENTKPTEEKFVYW